MREVGKNNVGTDFLSFPLTTCQCYVGVESICYPALVVSVQPPDSGTMYPWSISSLFWVLLPQSLLQKVEQSAEHLVLVAYLSHIHCSVYMRKEGRKQSMWSISQRCMFPCI